MRNSVKVNGLFIAIVAVILAAGSVQAALVTTFDFEGTDTGLTISGTPVLSTEQAVTGSQSMKMPAGSDYYADYFDMLSGLTNKNIGTVVMRIYVESTEGYSTDDNAQIAFIEINPSQDPNQVPFDPEYRCLELNHGWPSSGELGYHTFYRSTSSPKWLTTGKALSADDWYTVAVAFNGVYGDNPIVSIWAAQGTEVTPADLVIDQTPFGLEAFSFDYLHVNGTWQSTFYMDNVQIYDTYGEGITGLTPGDANGDGIVDGEDASALADNWLRMGDATWRDGDFNNDHNVDDIDATILAANWQTAPAASASVPEPSIAAMLLLGRVLCIWTFPTSIVRLDIANDFLLIIFTKLTRS